MHCIYLPVGIIDGDYSFTKDAYRVGVGHLLRVVVSVVVVGRLGWHIPIPHPQALGRGVVLSGKPMRPKSKRVAIWGFVCVCGDWIFRTESLHEAIAVWTISLRT